jgi:hypothetical protein
MISVQEFGGLQSGLHGYEKCRPNCKSTIRPSSPQMIVQSVLNPQIIRLRYLGSHLDCQILRAALHCTVEKSIFNVCRTTLQTFFHNEIIAIGAQNASERLHGCPYLKVKHCSEELHIGENMMHGV